VSERAARARRIYFGVVAAVLVVAGLAYAVSLVADALAERRKAAVRDAVALQDAARAVHVDHEHGFRFELSLRFKPQTPDGADKTLAAELLADEVEGFRERVSVHVEPIARERKVYRVDTLHRLFTQYHALVPHEEEIHVGSLDALVLDVEFPEAQPPLHTLMLVVFAEDRTIDIQCTAPESRFVASLPAFQAAIQSFAVDSRAQ
jgi:hypothetical protein